MKPMQIAMALLSAVMFFILAGVFMGVQLELNGTKLVVDTAADIRWQWIFIGTAVVFFFQLLRPLFQKAVKNVSGPKFIMPAIDGSTVKQKLFLIALLVIAVAWPFMVSRGTVDIATLTMIYIILGLGLNVVVGLSGLLVLGYGGFYAIGAYTFALLNHYYGLGFWTCLPLAGLVSAAAGFLLGFPVLRLRGDYLAIVTLGFGEIVRILLLNNTEITGGPNGISQIPKPTFFGLEFSRSAREGGWDTFSNFFGVKYDPSDRVIFLYLVALLLVVLSLFVINRLLRMPLGRAWEALREDEIACRSLGLSPTRIKLTAFTISAAFAGFAGTLFAARQGFVSPESFTFAESAFVLAIVVLGGMGSQFAVILAAILLVVSRELMRDFNEYSMLMLGGLMVLMMIWRPQGLLPMTRVQLKLKKRSGERRAGMSQPLLSVSGLMMRFGGLLAVNNVSLELREREIVSLIGPNGAGKTTVFNCLTGFYKPTGGTILLRDQHLEGLPGQQIARMGVVRTFQHVRLFREMTVIENLLVAQHQQLKTGLFSGLLKTPAFRRAQSEALDRAATWLERIGLLEHANRQASNLAYGDQRRLEIARCMVTQPEILMLDEPAAGLNPKETKELDELIAELRNHHNTTILLIEHDMKLVMGISDRIYVVNQGTPLANGTPEEIRNNPDVIRAYLGEA
ncbi:leucine/isoleucine/valine transporter permease subunit [Klebsiella pneumoniae]|nr:branched-chain amino acid transport system permease LivM [Klebsiella pneumoniae]STT40456.1 branched-chain amino acid transport system permease LivM [Klebsiella pneumoniae]VEC03205.1 leucine/isoleucine/valine transporter permease subunit [Klebsiella pneumoniae]